MKLELSTCAGNWGTFATRNRISTHHHCALHFFKLEAPKKRHLTLTLCAKSNCFHFGWTPSCKGTPKVHFFRWIGHEFTTNAEHMLRKCGISLVQSINLSGYLLNPGDKPGKHKMHGDHSPFWPSNAGEKKPRIDWITKNTGWVINNGWAKVEAKVSKSMLVSKQNKTRKHPIWRCVQTPCGRDLRYALVSSMPASPAELSFWWLQ